MNQKELRTYEILQLEVCIFQKQVKLLKKSIKISKKLLLSATHQMQGAEVCLSSFIENLQEKN